MITSELSNKDIVLKIFRLVYGEDLSETFEIVDLYEPVTNIELYGSNSTVTIDIPYTFYGYYGDEVFSNLIMILIDIDGNVEKQYLLDCFNSIRVMTIDGFISVSSSSSTGCPDVVLVLSDRCEYTEDLEDLIDSIRKQLYNMYESFMFSFIRCYDTVKDLLLKLDKDKFDKF